MQGAQSVSTSMVEMAAESPPSWAETAMMRMYSACTGAGKRSFCSSVVFYREPVSTGLPHSLPSVEV